VTARRVRAHGLDRETQRIPVRHRAEVHAAVGRESDEVPGAPVHLEQLELPVARVVLELGLEDPAIGQVGEQAVE
jgi:hypothetical protein